MRIEDVDRIVIDWSRAPDWANYALITEDGFIYWYANHPRQKVASDAWKKYKMNGGVMKGMWAWRIESKPENQNQMNYNDLSESQQRLAVVKFEMTYPGDFPYGLVARTMERVNPQVFKTKDLMYLPANVNVIMEAMIIVQQEADEMVRRVKEML